MFDMMKIGRRISELRREKDMTQMELSDKLGISHQAVSKWERGESMPDISTLPLLSEIFGVTVDGLLESTDRRHLGESNVLKHVLDDTADAAIEDGSITLDDIARVAPILKPVQIDHMTSHFPSASIGEISGIAPYLSHDILDGLAERADAAQGIGELSGIAPFVSREIMDKLAERVAEVASIGELSGIAPFVSREVLDKLAERAAEVGGIGELCGIAPFLSQEALGQLAIKAGLSASLPLRRGF